MQKNEQKLPIFNQNLKQILGRAQHPPRILPQWEETPLPTLCPLRSFRRLEPRAFSARPPLHKILNTSQVSLCDKTVQSYRLKTPTGSSFHNRMTLNFDLFILGSLYGEDLSCTLYYRLWCVDCSSRFPLIAHQRETETDRQTDRQTKSLTLLITIPLLGYRRPNTWRANTTAIIWNVKRNVVDYHATEMMWTRQVTVWWRMVRTCQRWKQERLFTTDYSFQAYVLEPSAHVN